MRQRGKTGHELACYEALEKKAHGDLHLGVRSYYFFAATAITSPRVHQRHGCDGRNWRPLLTAAGLGQSAVEFKELGHGVFTSALMDSLHRGDSNGDGTISLSELVSGVEDIVPRLIKDPKARAEFVRRGAPVSSQTARFGGRGEDFAFVHRLQ